VREKWKRRVSVCSPTDHKHERTQRMDIYVYIVRGERRRAQPPSRCINTYLFRPKESMASDSEQPSAASVLMYVSYLFPITFPHVKQRTGIIMI